MVRNPRLQGSALFSHVCYDVVGVLDNQEGSYNAVKRYSSFLLLRRAIIKSHPEVPTLVVSSQGVG
eukprot:m.147962 g.147962  ORF g.147962 m.147962 type:complete len:66 (-) comp16274_c0_seq13:242-439(-)